MAKYLTTDTDLTSVANAIRTKGGTSAPLAYPTGFVSAIDAIPTGGGGEPVEEKDVNFIDYDGTILYSYTASEAQALSELPANPSHDGLTAQGWNWTLAQIKSQLTNVGGQVWVGQMYVTTSGKTEIYIELDYPEYLSPYLAICVDGEVSVDWGDSSSTDTLIGTKLSTILYLQHVYANTGKYTIEITVNSGSACSYVNYPGRSALLVESDNANNNQAKARTYSSSIREVHVGSNFAISDRAFTNCTGLRFISIPKGLNIKTSAFDACYSLKCCVVPDDSTSDVAFVGGCLNLKKISLPGDLINLPRSGFTTCQTLKTITIPQSVTKIDNTTFYTDYFLTNIVLPNGVVNINEGAFQLCKSLMKIILPNALTSIGNSAFNGCESLMSITIPENVASIGSAAFSNCYGMKEYHLLPSTPPVLANSNAFQNIQAGTKMYVPRGKLTDYQTANNWSVYATYMEEEPA